MEWYFDDPTVKAAADLHITQAVALEETEAKRVLKRYKEIRQELADRLASLPRGSFEAQQQRSILVQVQSAIVAMSDDLKIQMATSTRKAAEKSIGHLSSEINKFNKLFVEEKYRAAIVPININAVAVASDVSNLLSARYESSFEGANADVYQRIASGLTDALIAQESLADVTTRISQTFLGLEWEYLRVARTELHNAYNLGKLKGMEDVQEEIIPDLQKALFHPIDHRTGKDSEYAASKNLVRDLDEYFEYTWRGKLRKFMAPPDRPNDRAILIPYRKAWKAAA